MKRLSLTLPQMDVQKPAVPTRCPYDDCQSTNLRLHQEVVKPLRDTRYQQVIAYRYQCMTCKRTFRVYPPGVNSAPTSQRVKELGITLYMLGLSYRAASHILEAAGVYLCASCIYSAVKTALNERPELRRQHIFEMVKTFSQTNTTKVRYHGRWLPLSLSVDGSGDNSYDMMLTLDDLTDEDAESLQTSIAPLAQVRVETVSDSVKPHEYALIPAEEQDKVDEHGEEPAYTYAHSSAICPPSITTASPVMNEASSEAR